MESSSLIRFVPHRGHWLPRLEFLHGYVVIRVSTLLAVALATIAVNVAYVLYLT